MLQLLYLLELIIPDLGRVIGTIGGILLVLGLIYAFFGKRLFDLVLTMNCTPCQGHF